ncbi:MAG: hypothetical protein ABI634_07565 [Acidobacteriota bacterium]
MATLENTVSALERLTDRQKVIVYVGPGVPRDSYDNIVRAMTAFFRMAERANVVVYTFDPTALDTLQDYVYGKALLGSRLAPRLEPPLMSNLVSTAQKKASEVVSQALEFSASVADNTGSRRWRRCSPTPDGKFHEVMVTVNSARCVRAREARVLLPPVVLGPSALGPCKAFRTVKPMVPPGSRVSNPARLGPVKRRG